MAEGEGEVKARLRIARARAGGARVEMARAEGGLTSDRCSNNNHPSDTRQGGPYSGRRDGADGPLLGGLRSPPGAPRCSSVLLSEPRALVATDDDLRGSPGHWSERSRASDGSHGRPSV